jgi:tetratricopeptide (TPR) repeat protein
LVQFVWQTTSLQQGGVIVAYEPTTGRFAAVEGTMPLILAAMLWLRQATYTELGARARHQPLRISAVGDQVAIFAGEAPLYQKAVRAQRVGLSLMGFSRSAETIFTLDSATLEGTTSEAAYQRVIDEKRAQRVRQLQVSRSKKQPAAEDQSEDASFPQLEPETIEKLDAREAIAFKAAVNKVQAFSRQQGAWQLEVAQAALDGYQREYGNEFEGLHFYRGYVQMLTGEIVEANQSFDQAIALDAQFILPALYKAYMLMQNFRFDEAQAAVDRLLKLDPGLAFARLIVARLAFYRRKDHAEGQQAIDLMEIASELGEHHSYFRNEVDQLASVLRGPPWPGGSPMPITSNHYELRTDLPEKTAQEMLEVLERTHQEYVKLFPPPAGLPPTRGEVYIYATLATFQINSELSMGQSADNALGYYHPGFKSVHLYQNPDQGGIETLDTLRHEGWHQYVDRFIPALPRWLNEGLAEYFGAMEIVDGKAVHKLQRQRLQTLRAFLARRGQMMSMQDLITSTTVQFMSNPSVSYGQAWSVVYMCMELHPDRYRDVLLAFIARIQAGETRELAYQASFGRIDLEAMQRDWTEALNKLLEQVGE